MERRLRLLLVHRSARVRGALEESFRNVRMPVCITAAGQAFTDAARRFRPDAIVTDDYSPAFAHANGPPASSRTVTWVHPQELERIALGKDPAGVILELVQKRGTTRASA